MSIESKEFERPRLISTASVCLTLPMQVPHLPSEGTSVTAFSSSTLVGDGFVVAASAARQQVSVSLASPLGTGTNSHAVRAALIEEGIELAVQDMVGDTGMSIALIQSDGLMTTVRSPGVEADPLLSDLHEVELFPGDYVYISGLDLAGVNSGPVLSQWASEIPEEVKLVLSLGGAIEDIPLDNLKTVLECCDVLTMNSRQSMVLAERFNEDNPFSAAWKFLPSHALLVQRLGDKGSIFQEGSKGQPIFVRSFPHPRVDTTGVGDTHTGVLISGLLEGRTTLETIVRANYASAIAVSRFGTAVCPRAAEIDSFFARNEVDVLQMYSPYTEGSS
ncbi:ribokinase [Actinomycetaceae bacterium TAE3-ERU4]|nr:ribokinase [Actinomycetaceae bacterium TAE3-ERU4]